MIHYSKIIKDCKGNVGMLFAMSLLFILAVSGLAVDISSSEFDKQRSQRVADSISLLTAKFAQNSISNSQAIKLGNAAFLQYDGQENIDLNLNHNITITELDADTVEVVVAITGFTPTTFMKHFKYNTVEWSVESAVRINRPKIEVALVADISASMIGSGKIQNLKTALTDFVTVIEPSTSKNGHKTISLIPYAETVNMGDAFKPWLSNLNGYEHSSTFTGCFVPEPNGDFVSPIGSSITPGNMQAYPESTGGKYKLNRCPPEESKVVLFSTKADELIKSIDSLELGYGTGTDIALLTGHRVLSQDWRTYMTHGKNNPKTLTDNTKKFLILMTDGKVVRSDMNSNAQADSKDGYLGKEERIIIARNNFIDVCKSIKDEGETNLYMIGYMMESLGNQDTIDALKNCISGTGKYYSAEKDDLTKIYTQIATDIGALAINR